MTQYYCTLCKCGLGDALVDVHLDGIKRILIYVSIYMICIIHHMYNVCDV
jgi:hypothetical protein